MKIERLNENQLRFTVWTKDFPDSNLTIADFAGHSEKAEELIKYMMDKAKEEFGFEANAQSVVVEAIPVNKDCIVFLITKMDEEHINDKFSYIQDLQKQAVEMAKSLKDGSIELSDEREEKDNISPESSPVDEKTGQTLPYMIYQSVDMERFITAAHIVKGYYDSDNTLYKHYDDTTYFLLMTHNRNSEDEFKQACKTVREFAEPYKYTYTTKYYIEEHYRKIIPDNALQTLAEL